MLLVWLYFPFPPLSFPFLSLSLNLSSLLPFLISPFIFLFSSSLLACLISSLIPLLLSPLARLSTFVLSSLFPFPLSALPVPRVQELTLASLTHPLLGALRATIGIKYSFNSFITFILFRLILNKSLIEPYY